MILIRRSKEPVVISKKEYAITPGRWMKYKKRLWYFTHPGYITVQGCRKSCYPFEPDPIQKRLFVELEA